MQLIDHIRLIPDHPKPGIVFYDITPILLHAEALRFAVEELGRRFADAGATKIVAAEARGFLFGAPLAVALGVGFVPLRKPGKLPYRSVSVEYDLEYGTDSLCMHEDALTPEDRVLIIDDLLATGGTAAGMVKMVRRTGAVVAGVGFVVELAFLGGGAALDGTAHTSLVCIDRPAEVEQDG